MKKLKAYERSNRVHIRLRNKASSKDDIVKEAYHNSVIYQQNTSKKKMTKQEKRKLFKSCVKSFGRK